MRRIVRTGQPAGQQTNQKRRRWPGVTSVHHTLARGREKHGNEANKTERNTAMGQTQPTLSESGAFSAHIHEPYLQHSASGNKVYSTGLLETKRPPHFHTHRLR